MFVDCFNEQTEEGETDPRLDISIGRPGQPWVNGDTFDASWSPTGYLVKKYEQPLSEVPVGTKSDGYLPYIYLRYADVLLMKAEALANRNTGTDLEDACDALDLVRGRAGLAPTTAGTPGGGVGCRTARTPARTRVRIAPLLRPDALGREIAVEALGPDIASVWTGDRFYFPIPQSELDSNKGIEQ